MSRATAQKEVQLHFKYNVGSKRCQPDNVNHLCGHITQEQLPKAAKTGYVVPILDSGTSEARPNTSDAVFLFIHLFINSHT